jgi:hypothetical protein
MLVDQTQSQVTQGQKNDDSKIIAGVVVGVVAVLVLIVLVVTWKRRQRTARKQLQPGDLVFVPATTSVRDPSSPIGPMTSAPSEPTQAARQAWNDPTLSTFDSNADEPEQQWSVTLRTVSAKARTTDEEESRQSKRVSRVLEGHHGDVDVHA